MVEGKAGIYSDQFVSPSPFLLYFCPVFRAGGAFLCKKKEGQFGTIDPNMGGWGRVVPNLYKSLFLWHGSTYLFWKQFSLILPQKIRRT